MVLDDASGFGFCLNLFKIAGAEGGTGLCDDLTAGTDSEKNKFFCSFHLKFILPVVGMSEGIYGSGLETDGFLIGGSCNFCRLIVSIGRSEKKNTRFKKIIFYFVIQKKNL